MSSPPPPPQALASASLNQNPRDALRSVNCTECGAPITLHGGHRVLSITCAYCGSELDAKDAFKVIGKFANRNRPVTPFELGMRGTFKGVEFTIIGLVQYRSSDGYGWIEFALFSPTHGYAWLEQVDNHFVFSRRVRDLPRTPIRAQVKTTFKVRDTEYRVFESYTASIIYVEGELTFVARAGDQVRITEGIAPPYVYSVERTQNEEEYVLGEYVQPEAVYASFKLRNEPAKRHSVHAAQPYVPAPFLGEMSRVAKYFTAAAAVLLAVVVLLGWGSTLLVARFDTHVFKNGAQSEPFMVSDPDKLLSLDMHAPVNNGWAAYDVQVHKDQKEVFSMAKQISYYSGYEGGESWSEGSQSAHAYFKVPEAGEYRLVIKAEGGTGNSNNPPNANLLVKVKEGIIVSRYFIALFIVCALAFITRYLTQWHFESKRWGDYDDDDD